MADLAYVLRHLPPIDDPNVLVGSNPADDAAVYRLRDDLALVQTVDFFTPIVDDPYVYGQIAAANSLSDIYAMGGRPLTALNIAAFPVKRLPAKLLSAVLQGGSDKAREAGVAIVGGHTVDDEEPKYGLAVTGIVHPERFLTAHGARAGDRLLLTKPLGTGLISTALKAGRASAVDVEQSVRWMSTLNRSACEAMVRAKASAATDITGYGLLGHLVELARSSGVSVTIRASAVPMLPGALAYAREGHSAGGTWTNLEYVAPNVEFDEGVEDAVRALLADPQTSGGLLVCLPSDSVPAFVKAAATDMLAVGIGEMQSDTPGKVRVLS